jgi:hypothetical protein
LVFDFLKTLFVISPAHTLLEQWRFTHFETHENTGDAADPADPDSDGIASLMEFALGLDPNQAATIPAILDVGGDVMAYTLTLTRKAPYFLRVFTGRMSAFQGYPSHHHAVPPLRRQHLRRHRHPRSTRPG